MTYRYRRDAVRLPAAQLNHITLRLAFHESHVDSEAVLALTAREPLTELRLDARDLEIFEVALAPAGAASLPPDSSFAACAHTLDATHRKLVIPLPQPLAPGASLRVFTRCRCVPSDTLLEGLYRDVTPPGAPQQYVSQCQQWGFQRILPVIDDCTAKCTFRTTLEGDARYTHLIANGDVDRAANPEGRPVPLPGDSSRQRITYVNRVPMAPYLFFAGAGTWEEVADEVFYPDGQRIALVYLVPPGRGAGARLPLAILKRAILWQHERTGYRYPFDTYRTICMEKSHYGGMENVGNTTIITEAALIDETTPDERLIYAHGVIVHEYEHNHCGSGVTMASPFDMWLNEAYTVDIERQFCAEVFDPLFMRLRETDAIRAPGGGPLAMEEAGDFGRIVREGFNDPDEVVDGVTYVKAPEVLNMLRQLLGEAAYGRAALDYFARYDGGNADTDAFLACFRREAGSGFDAFCREWLFSSGYPRVTVRHTYDETARTLRITLRQTRTGRGGLFTLPFVYAAADEAGRDLPQATGMTRFRTAKKEIVVRDVARPAFLSLNRDAGFYGTCEDISATPEQLAAQALRDRNGFNRVEAMRRLTDLERERLLADPAAEVSSRWRDVYRTHFFSKDLHDAVRGYLLKVDEQPLDRRLLRHVRERAAIRRALLRAAVETCGADALIEALSRPPRAADLAGQIVERYARNAWMQALSVWDTPAAHAALATALADAVAVTDRLNALAALWQSGHPDRRAILAREGESLRGNLNGLLGYLQVIGTAPREEVFGVVTEEEARAGFCRSHPGMSRALYVPLAFNNALVWGSRGLRWLTETAVAMAAVSEYNTLRLIAPCQAFRTFAPDLRAAVENALREMRERIDPLRHPSVSGRLAAWLETCEG